MRILRLLARLSILVRIAPAQEANSGFELRTTLSAEAYASEDLTDPPRGGEDQDRQPVDKAKHHRMWDHTDELPQAKQGERDLQNAHQHHCGKQILHSMLHYERDHHDRGGTGSS